MNDPIFLLCSERSGSNLIRAIIDSHPDIYAPMPVHLGLNFWKVIHRYGELSRDENWYALLRHLPLYLQHTLGKLNIEITEEELRAQLGQRNFCEIYRYIFTKGMRAAGKRRIFIKDNHCHEQLYFLLHYFPEAKIVFQVRDPRDYAVSCKGLRHYSNIFNALDVWRADQSAALEALYTLTPARVFAMRYEDLITDTEPVLRALCDFLSLPFSARLLEFHNKDEAQAAANRSQYWENLNKPILKENYAKFKTGLSRFELALIESQVGELMIRFGYQPTRSYAERERSYYRVISQTGLARLIGHWSWRIGSARKDDPDRRPRSGGRSPEQQVRAEVAALDKRISWPYTDPVVRVASE